MEQIWLVVWNMNGLFVHSAGIFIIPTEEVHHFSEGLVGQPPTRNRCESMVSMVDLHFIHQSD
jgi:hypothetical protein